MPAAELFAAVQSNDVSLVQALLAKETPTSLHAMKNGTGHSLMAVAAQHGRAHVVHELASKGMDVNEVDAIGLSPLHHAAMFGHVEVMKELVKHGASIEAKDARGMTALHCATAYDRARMRLLPHPDGPTAFETLFALVAKGPQARADSPEHMQKGGISDLQTLVNRAATHAGQAAVVGQHWKNVVANPKAPATDAARVGPAL